MHLFHRKRLRPRPVALLIQPPPTHPLLLCGWLHALQVELLLTLEEYCSGEAVFEADGGGGRAYDSIFAQVLKELYDTDVVSARGACMHACMDAWWPHGRHGDQAAGGGEAGLHTQAAPCWGRWPSTHA